MKRTVLFLSILFIFGSAIHAQQDIFKKHGFNKEPLTLSKGKYKETFTNEDVMQIGTVLIDTRTEKIVEFLEEDTTKFAYKAETTSRFLTIDPLAEKYYSWSPYVYVKNNPLKYIDPTGMAANPIYDENGSLLGTDDLGLRGKAIVMNKENFKQGMSHGEALKYNLGANGLKDKQALNNLENTQASLPGRPDYDGKLTLGEANDWYKNGDGKPLYVDGSKVDLSPYSNGDLPIGETQNINFFSIKGNLETGKVYGTIKVTVLDVSGNVRLGLPNGKLDTYDFDIQEGRTARNIATRLGKAWSDISTGKMTGQQSYDIYVYGTGKLKTK